MNLKETALLKHSKENTLLIVDWVGEDKEKYKEVMQLFLYDEYRVTQRISWVVSFIHDRHPEMIKPYLREVIGNLRKPDTHDAVKRNTVRVFQNIEIPEELWGELLDICFDWLADPKVAVAIRAFSMTVIWNICKKIPELVPELKAIIEDHLEHGTSGFKSRGNKILKEIRAFEKNNY